jgi:alginate O-acetyltransferase complex protein AlgI
MTTSVSTAIPAPSRLAAAAASAGPQAAEQKRIGHAAVDLLKFAGLAGQLALLLAMFAFLRVDEGGFLRMAAASFGAFLIHYWLPFRYKEPFWIAASIAGAALLVGPVVAGLVVGIGLLFYGIIALRIAFRIRLALLLAVAAALVYGRATLGFGAPWQLWPVLGAVFMFRLAIYVYDMRFAKAGPNLREFCAYFFPLPNFHFLLFPVIDFQTQRRTYYQRDIHAIAQQGIGWMVRGGVQLALYRLIYQLKPTFTPVDVTTFWGLVSGMVLVYLLYLRVSGHFHVIVGLMHLFGYDLPETHRRYLLASSLTDFWRRINIYWKDFMVKLVYFPVYFRLRKRGETLAQVTATAAVFLVTWATHSYQWFWFRGDVLFTWPDSLFWGILGAVVIVNVLIEQRARKAKPAATIGPARQALQVAATFSFIVVLWSLWQSPTVAEWLDTMTYWRAG